MMSKVKESSWKDFELIDVRSVEVLYCRANNRTSYCVKSTMDVNVANNRRLERENKIIEDLSEQMNKIISWIDRTAALQWWSKDAELGCKCDLDVWRGARERRCSKPRT